VNVDELIALAETPAPTGLEQARIAWLEGRLEGAPGTRARDDAGNLIWRFGDGTPDLLLMAHVDTVFPAETPLSVQRDGDWAIGPGIGDNAAAVMACVWALEDAGAPRSLAIAFTVGEEGLGNLRGALAACADLQPAMAVAVEGQGLDDVILEAVGSIRFRVRVSGPGGHSWWDWGTPSAIHALVGIADDLLADPVNIGRISGGGAANAIAAEAELLVERRSLDDDDLDALAEKVAELRVTYPLTLAVDEVGRRPAGVLERAHPLAQAAFAVRAELGLPDRVSTGSTDANAALKLGIPALTIGCSRGSGMHTTSERIDVSSLETGTRQVRALADRLAPVSGGA
jgi:acetylornithine deacetylase/succinyl-diaminopimelate desuccinylase-like protein